MTKPSFLDDASMNEINHHANGVSHIPQRPAPPSPVNQPNRPPPPQQV